MHVYVCMQNCKWVSRAGERVWAPRVSVACVSATLRHVQVCSDLRLAVRVRET